MKDVVVPEGWSVATVMDIGTASGGGTPPKSDPSYWTDGSIPWVSPKDMKVFVVDATEDTVTTKALDRLALIPRDSVLVVVRSGILARTLPVAINKVPATINQDMRAFVPANGVNSRFLAWQLIAKEREILGSCSKDGTTVASIEGPALAAYPLMVAPSNEQIRIVEKLEELLSDLDAGVAELKAAQRKLGQYRQSLLKAAVEGALTADWRAARARSGEPQETGADLLQRILTERRARWETKQLAKYAEQGKTPPKGWRTKYPEPCVPQTTSLPEIPTSWAWASLDQVVSDRLIGLDRGHDMQSLTAGNAGYVKMNNLTMMGQVDVTELVRIQASHSELERYLLESGDILFNTRNSRELVGKTGIVREVHPNTVFNNNLMRLRMDGAATPGFLCHQMCSPQFRARMEDIKKATTSVAAVYAKDLFPLQVVIPPLDEQLVIEELLAEHLARISDLEAATSKALSHSAAQRKNILKGAFAGQLVPQDPHDEPASVLLERIQAERTRLSAARGAKSAGSNRAPATRSPNQSRRGRKPRTTA